MRPIMTRFFNRTTEKLKRRILRQNMTRAESIIWSAPRGKQTVGLKFRRQYIVGPYVIDFYGSALKLAVEVYGDSHFHQEAEVYDRHMQAFIESFGILFMRFTNEEVAENLSGVLWVIKREVEYDPLIVPPYQGGTIRGSRAANPIAETKQ